MPSRFLLDTVEALTGTRYYADELGADRRTLVPARAVVRRRASRACGSRPPPRSTACTRCWKPSTAARRRPTHALAAPRRGAPSRARLHARARQHRVHPFRRQPRRAGDPEPRRLRGGGRLADAARTWAISPFDYLMEQVLRVEIPELPEEIYELSPLDRGSLVHDDPRRVPARGARRGPAARPRPARRGPTPTAPGSTSSPRSGATATKPSASPAGACSGTATAGACSPTSTGSSAPTTELRDEHELTTLATELRFGLPRRRSPRSRYRCPTGARCGSAARPTASTAAAAARSSSSTTRPAVPSGQRGGRPHRCRHQAATSRVRPRRARRLRHRVDAGRARRTGSSAPAATSSGPRYCSTARTEERVRRRPAHHRRRHRARSVPLPARPADSWPRRWRSYADPDGRGTRDRYREWARKRDAPELAAYLALEPAPADDADEHELDATGAS